jgi:hypothetical protein
VTQNHSSMMNKEKWELREKEFFYQKLGPADSREMCCVLEYKRMLWGKLIFWENLNLSI